MEQNRICKTCSIEKPIENFSFHSTTGYYFRECKECQNLERRLKHPSKESRKTEDGYSIRQKICIVCEEPKDRNSENFKKIGGNFSRMCRVCNDSLLAERRVKKAEGPLPIDTTRCCTRCNEDKSVTEFYYSPTKNKYYNYCIPCWKEKFGKDNRKERWVSNPCSNLMRTYRVFDENKGLHFDLNKEFVINSLTKSCTYCGYPSTGLDRLDNTLGHTEENCVPCCRVCNTAKMNNFTYEEMLIIGKAIKEVKDNRK